MDVDVRAINEKIERESAFVDLLTSEMNKVIIGQKEMIERLLIGFLVEFNFTQTFYQQMLLVP